jgi:hypothetical protein
VRVARGAVQKPAPDARGADVVDAAVEAFSHFRSDRGIHSVDRTTEEVVERVGTHRISAWFESSTSRLMNAGGS